MSNKTVTYRELIKEIRTLNNDLTKKLEHLETSLETKVSVNEFSEYKIKTNKLWDDRNKVIGYILGGGIVGGVAAQGLTELMTIVLAEF